MKKGMAMAVMALAVSAMTGSAFAANEPSKTTSGATQQNTIKAQLVAKPAISLEQMAKEKGITVEELIAQLKKEGKLKVSEATESFTIQPLDGSSPKEGAFTFRDFAVNDSDSKDGKTLKVTSLEDMAKEQGITVEELIAQLKKDGKFATATTTISASFSTDKDGEKSAMMKVINLEDMAKEKGITVEELIAQLQKEGKLAPAVKLVPATPVQN